MIHRSTLVLALVLGCTSLACADTLYVSAPPPQSPGHPLRLTPDRRASQVGDLVNVVFTFAVTSSSSNTTTTSKNYNIGLGAGTGNAALLFLRNPTGLSGTTGSSSGTSKNGTNTFSSIMMATVTDVLPSGALALSGIQRLIVNGEIQNLTVTGIVRPEDIDNTDSVPSTRIANAEVKYAGDFQDHSKGLIRKVLDVLF